VKTKAYLVGGGIGSLAAATFVIRDAGLPGGNISILEAAPWDAVEAERLYDKQLERDVIPEFYACDGQDIPHGLGGADAR